MPASPARLNIKRNIPLDGNPSDPQRIEACISGRETEEEATRRMAYGNMISATNNPHTINGQFVDLDTQLYCSDCGRYQFDREFDRDKTLMNNPNRRGRRYICKQCRASKPVYAVMDDETRRKLTKGSKRRKRK